MNDQDIRGIFGALLYDETVDEYELELLSFRQFKDFCIAMFGLNSEELKALSMFIQDYFIGESLDFKLLELIFTKMGIVNKKALLTDSKAKRIMARLNKHLKTKRISLEKFLSGKVKA